MAFNPFLNWSREDLERELRAAQEDYAAGKSTTKTVAGDVQSENRTEVSTIERIKQIYRALNVMDPVAYPIAQITAIDRTRAVFWGQSAPESLL